MRARSRVLAAATVGVVAGLLLSSTATRARADSSAIEVNVDLRFTHLRSLPDVTHVAADEGDGRALPEASVATGNAENFLGVGMGLEMAFHDRTRVPLFGFSLSSAIGAAPRVFGTIDGSIVEVDTWRSGLLGITFPGYGFRMKDRRWMFEGALQPGIAYLFTSGSIASGAMRTDTSFHATTFLLQLDVAACRRIDPIDRACVFAAPAIYGFGWTNAWTFGLRWEVGP